MTNLHTVFLQGCQVQPLASYLKALGIFRLVAEQKDAQAKGCWQKEGFSLVSRLNEADLLAFFLNEYHPTPIMAPWNGSTGFFSKDKGNTLSKIRKSTTPRLQAFREAIEIGLEIVQKMGLNKQPKGDDKKRLLTQLRNRLPDPALRWLDTCAVIGDEVAFPPLTGSGGNDGNFEFGRVFMQRLQDLFVLNGNGSQPGAEPLLKAALLGQVLPGLAFAGPIGQFSPMAAGGVNAQPGYEAGSRTNPWDYLLALEGTILFRANITRRYEHQAAGALSYPFMVRPSAVGYGTASEGDKARAELWVPVWDNPVGLRELQALFSEGRAKVQSRTAQNGVDFARGFSNLAVHRGIHSFIRYSFQERNGRSYFAIPLGEFEPRHQPQLDLLADIDSWLMSLARAISKDAPASVRLAHRQLEDSIFNLACGKNQLLDVLVALGQMEATLNQSLKFTLEQKLKPLPTIAKRAKKWLGAISSDSVEFRLAWSLAASCGGQPSMRERLVQVRGMPRPTWIKDNDGITTWQRGSLTKNLLLLLQREEIDRQQMRKAASNPESTGEDIETRLPQNDASWGAPKVTLDDIVAWIHGQVDETRLEAMLRGLCLLKVHNRPFLARKPQPSPPGLPPAFALILNVYGGQICKVAENGETQIVEVPRVPSLLARLTAGDCASATTLAIHRLRASGFPIGFREGIYDPPERSRRMGAALAFPLSLHERSKLLVPLLETKRDRNDSAHENLSFS